MTPFGALWRLAAGIAWAWMLNVAYDAGGSDQLRADESRIAKAEEQAEKAVRHMEQSDEDCAQAMAAAAHYREIIEEIEAATPAGVRPHVVRHLQDVGLQVIDGGQGDEPGPRAA